MANDLGADAPNDLFEVNPEPRRLLGFPWAALSWVFVLSRLFFFEAAGLAYMYLPHAWVESPQGVTPPTGDLLYRILGGLWVHWDGFWYLSIARLGYSASPHSTAFFPLYPLLMHLVGSRVVSGVILSMAFFVVALWFLYRLVSLELGPRVAWYTLLALAFFPTAFYFNAVYSESLFLMLAVASLYFLRQRRYWIAGPLGALATGVVMYGILLALPFLWMLWKNEGHRLRPLAHILWMPLGLLAYMGYLVPLFGDPLVFEQAQANWGRHFELFPITLWNGLTSAYHAIFHGALIGATLFATGQPSVGPMQFYDFIFAIFAIVIAIVSFRRMPFYLWILMVAAILVPLSYPANGDPLMSMPRLNLEAFPLFIGLGTIMARTRWVRTTYFVLAIPLGLLFVSLFATAHWVA